MRLRRAKNEHRLGQGLAAIGKGRLIISDSYETRSVISTRLPSNPTGHHTHPSGTGCAHQDSTSCTSTTVTQHVGMRGIPSGEHGLRPLTIRMHTPAGPRPPACIPTPTRPPPVFGGELFVDTPVRFRIRVIREPCHGDIRLVLLGDQAAEFSCTHIRPICDACLSEDLVTGLVTENMCPVSETGHAPPLDTMLRHVRRVAPDANGQAETKNLANNSPRGLMVGDVGIEPTTPSV